jgi:hypothetical protein
MERRSRRRRVARQPSRWNADEWQRAWELAMMRIEGMPAIVAAQPAIEHGLEMLDVAFRDGDRFQFELGLLTLMDCCFQSINRGDCQQWWYCSS